MIVVNIDKAKTIGHAIRRDKRAEEFAPLDDQIAKRIPGQSLAELEAQRAVIRNKYVLIQDDIDAATTADEIKAALP